ncbi:hypothetical protein L484_019465 [Morus notabilis]|uniref:Uncharacterized protein n=1 Tax=Morus notabilis TaxID=981085 RepID=W9S4W2_9ROSA|nr:hypothetical protein L484_019465 [Morus notabilis]
MEISQSHQHSQGYKIIASRNPQPVDYHMKHCNIEFSSDRGLLGLLNKSGKETNSCGFGLRATMAAIHKSSW